MSIFAALRMIDFFNFLKSTVFFKHVLIAGVSLVVVLWLMVKWLGWYTHHGETVEVPDFKGKAITELTSFISHTPLNYLIIDSVYNPDEKTGIVIKQDPEAKSLVKHNRTIYLYVTSTQPPQIAMPKLVDKSTRQAVFMIESYGLKVGRVEEVTADCKGCVLKQQYKGLDIEPGATIKKGSKIDLVIGKQEHVEVLTDTTSSQMHLE